MNENLSANQNLCPRCGGNDTGNMPCAYPGEAKPGCLRDARLEQPSSNQKVESCSHKVDCTNGIITYPPNVESTGENSDGDCDYYRCKTCGHEWKVCYEG